MAWEMQQEAIAERDKQAKMMADQKKREEEEAMKKEESKSGK